MYLIPQALNRPRKNQVSVFTTEAGISLHDTKSPLSESDQTTSDSFNGGTAASSLPLMGLIVQPERNESRALG